MNQLKGTVVAVEWAEAISLVTVEAMGHLFSALVIDSPETATYVGVGNPVVMVFKETEVSIGKNLSGGLSLRNRFASRVNEVKRGKVLSQLTLDFKGELIVAIITTRSVQELDLQIGDQVEGLVKTNEVTLTGG